MNSRNFWLGFVAALAGAGIILWRRLANEQPLPSPPAALRELSPVQATQEPDPLEEIQGIGPVFARRLRAAGVNTFRQLAELPEERIRTIAEAKPWQADIASWKAQARDRTS